MPTIAIAFGRNYIEFGAFKDEKGTYCKFVMHIYEGTEEEAMDIGLTWEEEGLDVILEVCDAD